MNLATSTWLKVSRIQLVPILAHFMQCVKLTWNDSYNHVQRHQKNRLEEKPSNRFFYHK